MAKARQRASTAVQALQAANSTLDDVPGELAATLATVHDGRLGSELVPRGSVTGGFGPGFGSSDGADGTLVPRRAFGAERHPSMHIAAQIASATTLTLAPPAAAAVVSGLNGSPGMASILEGPEDGGVSVVMNGVSSSSGGKSVTIKVEGE